MYMIQQHLDAQLNSDIPHFLSLFSQSGCSVTFQGLILFGLSARLFLACSKTFKLSSLFISSRNCCISWLAVLVDASNSRKRFSGEGCFVVRGAMSLGIVVRRPRSWICISFRTFIASSIRCSSQTSSPPLEAAAGPETPEFIAGLPAFRAWELSCLSTMSASWFQ